MNGHSVKSGQGFLIHDGMYAEHHADENDPWGLLWITLYGETAAEIFGTYGADPNTRIFDYGAVSYAQELAQRVVGAKSPQIDSLELLEIFLRLRCYSLPLHVRENVSDAPRLYLDCAVKYIRSNLHRPLRVEELAAHIGVDRSYLYKLFRGVYGVSPKQYILQAKTELAKNLLIHTDMKISEIATSLGYEDALCFSKMFAAHEHISPQRYRASLVQKEPLGKCEF